MRTCAHPIAALLPHAPPMVLLDSVVGWDTDRVAVTVAIRPGIPFFVAGRGVPAHVGIEYMAQACGAFAGIEALEIGAPVRIGYLLGTRRYRANVDWFPEGVTLTVTAVQIFRDSAMGVFECAIADGERELATAQLNVYQPEETQAEDATGGAARHG
ncbi:MAG: 3-hydroxylacyl-ACP dehydratase [Gemmatimonas sp.]